MRDSASATACRMPATRVRPSATARVALIPTVQARSASDARTTSVTATTARSRISPTGAEGYQNPWRILRLVLTDRGDDDTIWLKPN